jgi:hypothetical protein
VLLLQLVVEVRLPRPRLQPDRDLVLVQDRRAVLRPELRVGAEPLADLRDLERPRHPRLSACAKTSAKKTTATCSCSRPSSWKAPTTSSRSTASGRLARRRRLAHIDRQRRRLAGLPDRRLRRRVLTVTDRVDRVPARDRRRRPPRRIRPLRRAALHVVLRGRRLMRHRRRLAALRVGPLRLVLLHAVLQRERRALLRIDRRRGPQRRVRPLLRPLRHLMLPRRRPDLRARRGDPLRTDHLVLPATVRQPHPVRADRRLRQHRVVVVRRAARTGTSSGNPSRSPTMK